MPGLSRRRFLAESVLAAGAAAVGGPQAVSAASTGTVRRGTDLVTLGRSGIRTTLLGLGTNEHVLRRTEDFHGVVRYAVERGLRFIDTADTYGSHVLIREALRGVDRSSLFIQTKTRSRDPEQVVANIEQCRRELGAETLDAFLIHRVRDARWPTDLRPVMEVLNVAQEKGRIRAVGVSCHGGEPLDASVGVDWIDLHLTTINPFGRHMDAPPEHIAARLKQVHEEGRGVMGMKLFGGGDHAAADDRRQSLRFVLGLGCVDSFVIGFTSPREIGEVLDEIETTGQDGE